MDQQKPSPIPQTHKPADQHTKDPAAEGLFRPLNPDAPPKPGVEAIAVALQAIQQLAHEVDSETAAEESTAPEQAGMRVCQSCGAQNRPHHRFCATCGVAIGTPVAASDPSGRPEGNVNTPASPAEMPAGTHHYHHHYHHHFMPSTEPAFSAAGPDLRNATPAAPARDLGRIRAPLGGPSLSRTEAAVRKMTQDFALACNTKQLDDIVDLYGPDAIILRPNVPPIRGTAAIREFFVVALDSGLGEVEMEPLRLELFGDIAYEAGRYKMLVAAAMGKRREERGKYLTVVQRQANGDWKLVADCLSSDLGLGVNVEPIAKTAAPSLSPLTRLPRKG